MSSSKLVELNSVLQVDDKFSLRMKWAVLSKIQWGPILINAHPLSMAVPVRESLQALWCGPVEEVQQGGRCDSCNGKRNDLQGGMM